MAFPFAARRIVVAVGRAQDGMELERSGRNGRNGMERARVFPGAMSLHQERLLLASCSRIPVSEGQKVIARGEDGNDMYIVEEGSFKVVDESSGEDFVLTVLEPWDLFGEMSFIDGMPRSATVVAMEDATLLRLGPTEFSSLQRSDQSAATALMFSLARLVVRRLRKTDEALLFMAAEEEGQPAEADRESELERLIMEMTQAVDEELSRSASDDADDSGADSGRGG